ncbi:hypothetical protein GJAV_G00032870 [Gymnothorax javanicus]|nr:hypothetical protein GJAV_G00032870 [Gymnothorax javanicus]
MGGMGMGAQSPVRSKSSSNTGLKLAGAAAAGAVGGAMIGHGLSSMGRPGYGYGGYGGYGYGGYGGYGGYPRYGGGYGGRRYENTDEFRNDTNGEYYYDSGCRQAANGFVILGFMVFFLILHSIPGHWMGL